MKTKEKVIKLPNSIISNDCDIHPSTISVAMVFYSNMNKKHKFTNSLANIAVMAHKCKDTVRQAVEELERTGYIKRTQNFFRAASLDRSLYAQTTYRILKPVEKDYTLIPYAWLEYDLTPCTLQVLLTCKMFMILDKNRSFPSLRRIAAHIKIAKSTVCKALNRIAELGILLVEHCQKKQTPIPAILIICFIAFWTNISKRRAHHIVQQ